MKNYCWVDSGIIVLRRRIIYKANAFSIQHRVSHGHHFYAVCSTAPKKIPTCKSPSFSSALLVLFYPTLQLVSVNKLIAIENFNQWSSSIKLQFKMLSKMLTRGISTTARRMSAAGAHGGKKLTSKLSLYSPGQLTWVF